MSAREVVVLYSGGTDSTCVAALAAEQGAPRVHLLTFEESATRGTPVPTENVRRLKEKFGSRRFVHRVLGVDWLLRRVSYGRYFRDLRLHGLFMLATPGFSSLSWHARAVLYCLEHGVTESVDGVTRELAHFPGHMESVQAEFRRMYEHFGVRYRSPVREWEVPPDRRFLEQMVVDRHAELSATLEGLVGGGAPAVRSFARTTGSHLHDLGLMPAPDVKGTAHDRAMQHACYPFVLFNMLVFWHWLAWGDYAAYERRIAALLRDKTDDMIADLVDYRRQGLASALGAMERSDPHA